MLFYRVIDRILQAKAIRSTLAKESDLPSPEQIGGLFSGKIGQVEPSPLSIKMALGVAYKKRGSSAPRLDKGMIDDLCEKISPLHEYLGKTSPTYAESDSETRIGMRKKISRFAALHRLPIESAAQIVDHFPSTRGGNVRTAISTTAALLLSALPPLFFGAPPIVSLLLFPIVLETVSGTLYRVRRDLLPPEHFPCLEHAPKNVRAPLTVVCATLGEHREAARALCELYLSGGNMDTEYALFLDLPDAEFAECADDREKIDDAVAVTCEISKEHGKDFLLIIRRREYDPRGGYIGRSENRDPAVDLTRFILGRRSVCTLAAGSYDQLLGLETVLIVDPSCRFPDRFIERLSALLYHPDNKWFGGFFIGTDKICPKGSTRFFSTLDICPDKQGFVFYPQALGQVVSPEPTVNDPMARKKMRVGYIGQIKLKGVSNIGPGAFFAAIKKGAREHIAAADLAITVEKASFRRILSALRACLKDMMYLSMFTLVVFCALLYAEGNGRAAAASLFAASLYFILPIIHSIICTTARRSGGAILRSVTAEFFRLSSLPLCALLALVGALCGLFSLRVPAKVKIVGESHRTARFAAGGEIVSVLGVYLLILIAPSSPVTLIFGPLWLSIMPMVLLLSTKCSAANIPKL